MTARGEIVRVSSLAHAPRAVIDLVVKRPTDKRRCMVVTDRLRQSIELSAVLRSKGQEVGGEASPRGANDLSTPVVVGSAHWLVQDRVFQKLADDFDLIVIIDDGLTPLVAERVLVLLSRATTIRVLPALRSEWMTSTKGPKKKLRFLLFPGTISRLDVVARQLGVTRNELYRTALEAWLEKHGNDAAVPTGKRYIAEVAVPEVIADKVDVLADRESVTRSEICRRAVEAHLEAFRKK